MEEIEDPRFNVSAISKVLTGRTRNIKQSRGTLGSVLIILIICDAAKLKSVKNRN